MHRNHGAAATLSRCGATHRRRSHSRRGHLTPFGRVATACTAVALATALAASAQTLQNPRRIAEGPSGSVLVSDRLGSVVAVDKATLQPLGSFALPDEGAPFGLATWNRLVFVGNTVTRNVEVYRLTGPPREMRLRFEYNLGHVAPGEIGPFSRPTSLAVDRRQHLVFVLDAAAKSIQIFDRKGTRVDEFEPRDGAGELLSPVALAVDQTRSEILVSDYGDPSGFFRSRKPARILIYDYQGQLLFQIDGNGSTDEATQFMRLQGMAVDGGGRILAADALGGRVLVVDRETGAHLGDIGTAGSAPGQLMLPLDVLADAKTGDLFVVNNQGARKIEAFRAGGGQP